MVDVDLVHVDEFCHCHLLFKRPILDCLRAKLVHDVQVHSSSRPCDARSRLRQYVNGFFSTVDSWTNQDYDVGCLEKIEYLWHFLYGLVTIKCWLMPPFQTHPKVILLVTVYILLFPTPSISPSYHFSLRTDKCPYFKAHVYWAHLNQIGICSAWMKKPANSSWGTKTSESSTVKQPPVSSPAGRWEILELNLAELEIRPAMGMIPHMQTIIPVTSRRDRPMIIHPDKWAFEWEKSSNQIGNGPPPPNHLTIYR